MTYKNTILKITKLCMAHKINLLLIAYIYEVKKIIIYDDDRDLLEVCSIILAARNFEVINKDNCNAIIDDIEEHRPDVILMDNWIPDIGGVKAIQLIKGSSAHQDIPVILFTANNNIKELAAEAGADYSLQKPFDISELEQMVINAVSAN